MAAEWCVGLVRGPAVVRIRVEFVVTDRLTDRDLPPQPAFDALGRGPLVGAADHAVPVNR
jgi:hypothetical protein